MVKRKIGISCVAILAFCSCATALTLYQLGSVTIGSNERGIIISAYTDQGYRPEVLQPGIHWVLPGEYVNIYDLSRQTYEMSNSDSVLSLTKDEKNINIDVTVDYAIDPAKVLDLYITQRHSYDLVLVRPLTRNTIRKIISQYTNEEATIIAYRMNIEQSISRQLETQFSDNGLIFFKFIILDVKPSK